MYNEIYQQRTQQEEICDCKIKKKFINFLGSKESKINVRKGQDHDQDQKSKYQNIFRFADQSLLQEWTYTHNKQWAWYSVSQKDSSQSFLFLSDFF